MVTNVFVSNALATVAADVDINFITQDNAIFATGSSTGAAILNLGTTQSVVDAFAAAGSIAYDTANNHIQVADGAYLTFAQNIVNATVALVSQDTTGGTLDLTGGGLSFTPDVGDGKLALVAGRYGATFSVSFDGTGTINFGVSPVITISKDFSLNIGATTYTGVPIAGNIHGDGVNDVYATLVNGTQIALISNGTVGANLNLGGIPLNNVTLSGALVFDPLSYTLTFAQGSSLGVDLGTRHIDFTATDNAGGQLTFGANGLTFKTAGGDGGLILSVTENGTTRQTNLNVGGEVNYSLDGSITLGAGTDFMSSDSIPVELSDVGVYAVNGTFITNYVAGSTFVSNADGSIVYNGATYAAGNFAIDASGNGIGIVTSADLAGDFLPNYDNDFANALQIVNAGTLDNQLPEILPVNADLGEVSFDTQADKLTKPQIVIAPDK